MPEKLRAYVLKLKGNIDRVVLVVFIILLALVIMNYLREQSVILGPPEEKPPTPWDAMLPNPQYEKVIAIANTDPDPEKAKEFKPLWEYNMFDYKTVRDRDLILKEYDQEYLKAEDFFTKGKYAEAKDIIDKILLHWPSHIKSRDLLKQIEAAQPKPDETPKPK